jgi:hypothetical protein
MTKLPNREQVIVALRRHRMKRFAFALLLNLPSPALSSWLNNRTLLAAGKRKEIAEALLFLDAFAWRNGKVPVDFSNVEAIRPHWEEWRRREEDK